MLLKGSAQLQLQQTGSAETTAAPELPGSSAVDKSKNTCFILGSGNREKPALVAQCSSSSVLKHSEFKINTVHV